MAEYHALEVAAGDLAVERDKANEAAVAAAAVVRDLALLTRPAPALPHFHGIVTVCFSDSSPSEGAEHHSGAAGGSLGRRREK